MPQSPEDRLRTLVRGVIEKLAPVLARLRARVEAILRHEPTPSRGTPSPIESVEASRTDRERERLVAQLTTDESWRARVVAANALAELRGDVVVDALIRAVRDPSAEVAVAAIASLACQPDDRAVADLHEVLRTSDAFIGPFTRAAAVEAIARVRGVASLPLLLDALHDGHAEVSMAAVDAVALVAPDQGVARLLALLEDRSGYYLPVVRIAVAKAMERASMLDRDRARTLLGTETNESVRLVLERVAEGRT